MKVVILAGGLGTRLSEETTTKPKPMVEIGGKPILWHIMKIYSKYGFNDFLICLGYKGNVIKEYFSNYFLHNANVTFDMANNSIEYHNHKAEPWKVSLINTGDSTSTGGRIKKLSKFLSNDKPFFLTYGDGVANVNIKRLLGFHKQHKKLATVTAVNPMGRFGALTVDDQNTVTSFLEKPISDNQFINGGFFVLEPEVLEYIDGDHVMFENEPLENLTKDGQLKTYIHNGFWKPMDTLRDKNELNNLWASGTAPWKVWN